MAMANRTVAISNNRGFTLIEFLAAIVILMVGMLGLLQSVNLALNHNLQNQIRNEAVNVADTEMAKEMAKGYDQASITAANYFVRRQILNGYKNYSVSRTGQSLQNSKQINFVITWRHKGTSYDHGASTVISKTNQ